MFNVITNIDIKHIHQAYTHTYPMGSKYNKDNNLNYYQHY